ncbi:HAD family hydrolase [Pseudomonas chlororaphis]|uniref:HAD family hydrolase n=1 Tax=Pseudomonas chlororaphis TaxID=587753 RepID=UPI000471C297|nr:HAD-IB family phosphatase [Pseudomonas chlororaphis]
MQHEGLRLAIPSLDGVKGDCTAAFFDLDNTILDMHTMILFARYLSDQARISEHKVSAMLAAVKDAEIHGAVREQTNGIFFSILGGMSEEEYLHLGSQWWEQAEKKFVEPILMEFELLKGRGVHVVAVSGSYSCCVRPIIQSLNMTAGFGSEPEVSSGLLTGKVRVPMVGEQKRAQLLEYLSTYPALISSTLAYGDHPSDFPMLSAASNACFVHSSPTDAETLSYVHSRGWRVVTV